MFAKLKQMLIAMATGKMNTIHVKSR